MFIIAGVHPKTKKLDTVPRLCPSCGQMTAHQKQTDHYFSLFFIPILRVKKGVPFLACDTCQNSLAAQSWAHRCKACGKSINSDFKYCPFCGKLLSGQP